MFRVSTFRRFSSAAALAFAFCIQTNAEEGSDWKEESAGKGVTIYSRAKAGSDQREFKGIGLIEAPPAVVFAVLDDIDNYPKFMPYTAQSRVLKREKDSVIIYQRLNVPLISDRDYTLRTRYDKWTGDNGTIYRLRWQTANDLGPVAVSGVLRVAHTEGGWLLEPEGKSATRGVYTVHSDTGGAIPAFLANSGSRTAVRKLFEAVRKQVKEPKYTRAAE